MKLIKVSDEEYDQLMKISHELNTQDNRVTADPIWIIFDKQKIPTSDEYSDNYYWYDSVNHCKLTEEQIKKLLKDKEDDFTKRYREIKRNQFKDHESIMSKMGYERVFYIEVDTRPKGMFLTEKACKAWQQQNKHHLSDRAYDFVESLWRNPEMQLIRKILLTLKKRRKKFMSIKELIRKILLTLKKRIKNFVSMKKE